MAEVVIVVSWNSAATIEACLRSVPPGLPVVLVDNASSDDTLDRARSARPDVHVIALDENLGFGRASNLGARQFEGRDVLLLNPDAALLPGAFDLLVETLAQEPTLGMVGPLITDEAGGLELSWGDDPTLMTEWRRQREHNHPPALASLAPGRVDWVTGACCLIRRAAWDACGGFDEGYFLYFEDLDLCRRVRALDFGVLFDPRAEVRHLRGVSAAGLGVHKAERYRASQLRYYRRYAPPLTWLGLRLYLVLKFLASALWRPRHAAVFARIVAMAVAGGERQSSPRRDS